MNYLKILFYDILKSYIKNLKIIKLKKITLVKNITIILHFHLFFINYEIS